MPSVKRIEVRPIKGELNIFKDPSFICEESLDETITIG